MRVLIITVLVCLAVPATAVDGQVQLVLSWQMDFSAPHGIGITPEGKILVADTNHDVIKRFLSDGTHDPFPGGGGVIGNGISSAFRVTVDLSGNVFVASPGNDLILKYDADGNLLTSWGGLGTEDGQFRDPVGLAVDQDGNVYVSERAGNRVQKFSNDGQFLLKFGEVGFGDGQFNGPDDLAVDGDGNIYVGDTSNSRIQVFSPAGVYQRQFTYPGMGLPQGLWIDSADGTLTRWPSMLFVANSSNVYVFTLAGSHIMTISLSGAEDVVTDDYGFIYVIQGSNNQVSKFEESPLSVESATWGVLKSKY